MGNVGSTGFRRRLLGLRLCIVLALWGAGAATGYWMMVRYETAAGKGAVMVQESWPAKSQLKREVGKVTVVMAAHPECPCSRASVAELEELLARHPGKVECYVLFVTQPTGGIGAEECKASVLWKQAAGIEGVTCVVDQGHEATEIFGARTSGQILAYDMNGKLQFSGGITAARDHVGPNAGIESLTALVETGATRVSTTPVFGCALR